MPAAVRRRFAYCLIIEFDNSLTGKDSVIAKLTRANAETIIARLKKVYADLSAEYGVAVRLENPVFDGLALKAGLVLASVEADGTVRSREQTVFQQYATHFGLDPSDFGREFWFRSRRYTIVGLNLNAPKFCVNGKRDDGKVFRFPRDVVQRSLPPRARAA